MEFGSLGLFVFIRKILYSTDILTLGIDRYRFFTADTDTISFSSALADNQFSDTDFHQP